VAQWGGWSEYSGREWTHYLTLPELQGLAVTTLLPDGDSLWIGTQQRGIAEYAHSTGQLRWHDDRGGLPDDWIKYLSRQGDTLCAGTFIGGLAYRDDEGWTAESILLGEEVTALATGAEGSLFIGTRKGLWRRQVDGTLAKIERPFLDEEVQALQVDGAHLWVGTRTGLFVLKDG
jgi:ligand-binding sensor domain-containing protein